MDKRLRLPATLAVVVLSACGDDTTPMSDAAMADAALVDAAMDAGSRDAASDACPPLSVFNVDAGRCICEPFAQLTDGGICQLVT